MLRFKLWVLVVFALAGCSALQVDVDVFKGALVNQQEVQERQFTMTVLTTKSFLLRFRAALDIASKKCPLDPKNACLPDIEAQRYIVADLLAQFERNCVAERAAPSASSNVSQADFAQQAKLFTATTGACEGLEDLAQRYFNAANKAEQRESMDKLTTRAIVLAQRILVNVDQQAVFKELRGPEGPNDGILKAMRPVLQSLGNILLVNANDLQRQADRDDKQSVRAGVERQALRHALELTPDRAYDNIVQGLTRAANAAASASAPASAADPMVQKRTALDDARKQLKTAQDTEAGYRTESADLVAAYRTLVGEPAGAWAQEKPSSVEQGDRPRDRKAIADLYPDKALAAPLNTAIAATQALTDWLGREHNDEISSERKARLQAVERYLPILRAGLSTDELGKATKSTQLLATMRAVVDLKLKRSGDVLAGYQAARRQAEANVARQAGLVAAAEKEAATIKAAAVQEAKRGTEAERVAAVLVQVRAQVLADSMAIDAHTEAQVHTLLESRLRKMSEAKGSGKPAAEDLQLALERVRGYGVLDIGACTGVDAQKFCRNTNQMDVIDELVASLRAQRIRALALGQISDAENLLAAINAAYDQRASMIYLRPASDYLRSIHTSTALQDATPPEERNLLNDSMKYWGRSLTKYLNSYENGDEYKREQLEKLNWQNINRVTLNGGGTTNFVLAKDDVGNWYVKAFSSDPKELIKSATSLALYNTGSKLNVNLLKRFDIRQRIETTGDADEKKRLQGQMDSLNADSGTPLLSLKERYATQYAASTEGTGRALKAVMDGIVQDLKGRVSSAKTATSPEACNPDDFAPGVGNLEDEILKVPRSALESALNPVGIATPKDALRKLEDAIQAGFVSLHALSGKVYRTIDAVVPACDVKWQRDLAVSAGELPRAQLLALARERRLTIERYETALDNIAEVAVQP